MATIYDNPKGFLIIEGSVSEFTHKCNFGIYTDTFICDNCNDDITTNFENGEDTSKAYYVAVLNMIFVKIVLMSLLLIVFVMMMTYSSKKEISKTCVAL